MRIVFIACVLLVTELHSRSLDAEEKASLKKALEIEALQSGGKQSFTSFYFTLYEDPKPVLNDSVFAFVQEYLDGYTGYLCSAAGDIRYTLEPCSKHVWECSDGKLLKKTCEGSSVFWFDEGICDSTGAEESTCKRKRKYVRGTSWPPKFIHVAKVKNATELSSLAPGSSPTLITTDCRKYETAYFEIKHCHPEYIVCNNGVRLMETCYPGLLFEDRILACIPKEICGAPTIETSRRPPTLLKDTPKNAELIRKLSADPILITIDCKKKRDGPYEIEKCHPNYIACRDGARTMQSCYGGQVFKLEKNCIELEECEEAWRKDATTTPAPIFEEEEERDSNWSYKMVLVPTSEDCVGKNTRRYAMSPCQAEYMYCFRDSGYKLKCSDGFLFSRRYLSCVGKEFCDV